MTSRLQNHLNMIGTCITVAQSPEHKPVWEGQEPADFATGGVTYEKALVEAMLDHGI